MMMTQMDIKEHDKVRDRDYLNMIRECLSYEEYISKIEDSNINSKVNMLDYVLLSFVKVNSERFKKI